ncbi:cathelicidin-2-like [Dendropsophus ebraccatus]|uniref:cathelicidin-2-like n=1 Tax=Dendropsophus ebraccatus TaxID=150705 RepID=UPI003831CD5F
MLGWRLSLLLLSAVTLHGCLSAEPDILEEKSTRDIVHLYNQREGVTYLYRAQLSQEFKDENPNRRDIIIRETVCLKSGNPDLSQCDFKPDGDMQICSLDQGGEDPEDIMCTSLTKDVLRFNRRRCTRRPCLLPGDRTPIFKPFINKNVF